MACESEKLDPPKPTMADQADRYQLYQDSVQAPECDVRFFRTVYKATFKREPIILREDFCGAAAVCCEWVRNNKRRKAIGVDLSQEALDWGVEHNIGGLTEHAKKRVQLHCLDVRKVLPQKADIIAAQNFSFFLFQTRDGLRNYFKQVYQNLRDRGGLLILDMMGGDAVLEEGIEDVRDLVMGDAILEEEFEDDFEDDYEEELEDDSEEELEDDSEEELESNCDVGHFRYHWEQFSFNPITAEQVCHIHFSFADGSRLDQAFTYQWRLWTIAEVRELMLEAGFSQAHVYWEEEDEDGNGTDEYFITEEAHNQASWFTYLVGVKSGA